MQRPVPLFYQISCNNSTNDASGSKETLFRPWASSDREIRQGSELRQNDHVRESSSSSSSSSSTVHHSRVNGDSSHLGHTKTDAVVPFGDIQTLSSSSLPSSHLILKECPPSSSHPLFATTNNGNNESKLDIGMMAMLMNDEHHHYYSTSHQHHRHLSLSSSSSPSISIVSPSGRRTTTLDGHHHLLLRDATCTKSKKQRPKRFRCPHCHVAFSNNGQLKGHVRIHTGERPFKCDHEECGKTFTRNEELTRHKRIHSGLRPYSCHLCAKKFGRKDHLKKHVKTHQKISHPLHHHHHHHPLMHNHHHHHLPSTPLMTLQPYVTPASAAYLLHAIGSNTPVGTAPFLCYT